MIYPTIKQLRYFLSLCEEGHFGRAAELSFISQSAFSTAIQDLEAVLDTQLVDRTNRQVTITAVGKEVATQARLCIRDVESLIEIAGQKRQPLEGPLRLGVIPTIAPFLLPECCLNCGGRIRRCDCSCRKTRQTEFIKNCLTVTLMSFSLHCRMSCVALSQ